MQMTLCVNHQGQHRLNLVDSSCEFIFNGVRLYAKMIRPSRNRSSLVANCNGSRGSRKQSPVRGVLGRIYSVFSRPAAVHSLSDKRLMDSNSFCPFRNATSYTINSNVYVRAGVSVLNLARSPSAIFGAVSLGVINAIYRMALGWPFSHVVKKVLVGIKPSVAHGNPLLAIPDVAGCARDGASRNNTLPYSVGFSSRKAVCYIVSCVQFFANAAARIGSSSKVVGDHYGASSALTSTVPERSASYSSAGEANHGKSSKLLSGFVFDRHSGSLVGNSYIIHQRALEIVK